MGAPRPSTLFMVTRFFARQTRSRLPNKTVDHLKKPIQTQKNHDHPSYHTLVVAWFDAGSLSLGETPARFRVVITLRRRKWSLVKDAQILDKRIEVFIKAVDRRMLVINNAAEANAKQLKKDSEKWGELPTGTRAELMSDISRIFDEAITNIDDVSARDEKNPLIPKALRKLAAAATRIVEQLKPMAAQIKGDSEPVPSINSPKTPNRLFKRPTSFRQWWKRNPKTKPRRLRTERSGGCHSLAEMARSEQGCALRAPPDRSGRALLPHPALVLGHGQLEPTRMRTMAYVWY